jgi:hypothetical protein
MSAAKDYRNNRRERRRREEERTSAAADHADQLLILFEGEQERHGTYDPARLRLVDDKVEMKDDEGNGAKTVPGPPTADLWRRHLAGGRPLGVRPNRSDDLCRWGVIDIDGKDVAGGYRNISPADLRDAVERDGLPLLVCRSKSGGAHLYLFLTDWTPQAAVNAALRAMAARLDLPSGTDVYPPEKTEGNWINMPYLGGDETDRYCVKENRLGMSVGEFLRAAEAARTTVADLERMAAQASRPRSAEPSSRSRGSPGADGAARAARDLDRFAAELAACPQGGRAKMLFGRAKDMGKWIGAGLIDEDAVRDRLLPAAIACGLTSRDAMGHIDNGIKEGRELPPPDDEERRYPLIGPDFVIWEGGEDVLWEMELAGHGRITMSAKEAMNYRTFNLQCAQKLRTTFRMMKEDAWSDRIAAALAGARVQEIPPDETVEGMFRSALRDFCMDRHHGEVAEDILHGKPAHIEGEGRIYFRFEDFQKFLDKQNFGPFRSAKRERLGRFLAGIGQEGVDLGKTTKKLKGRTTEVRWVRLDLFETQQPSDLPPAPPTPPV